MIARPSSLPPARPGCYIFRDARKRPLYVGKAKSLRARVASYFQEGVAPKIERLRRQADSLEFIVTRSEWEAFLLENNLIKQFKPRFNSLLKDDKTYPFIKLTVKDRFPKAAFTRRTERDGALYFGPFVPGWQAKKNLRTLQEHFKVATCRDPLDGSRKRPCLYFEMGQCFAPCMKGWVQPEAYREVVEAARLFLEGHAAELRARLEERMRDAARRQEYELAAHYRDLALATAGLGGRQSVARAGEGHWEYFALYGGGDCFVLHAFVVVDGKVVDRKRWRLDGAGRPAEEVLSAALRRLYGNAASLPDGVCASADFEDRPLLARFLSERKGRRVEVLVPRRGGKAALVASLLENARLEFESKASPAAVLAPLAEALGLPEPPSRIECFDVSHSAGEETVASCAVWESGGMRKSQYRHFRIKGARGADDFAALAEAVGRRYRRVLEEGGELPGLLLIDGGLGQVNAASESLAQVLPERLPVAGLAKREELLFRPGDPRPVALRRDSPALHLLQQIRDEAHRFALKAHRAGRSKARLASPLLEIPGVGPVTARRLLRAFMTTGAVKAASFEQLEKAVGKAAASKVRRWAESPETVARTGEP